MKSWINKHWATALLLIFGLAAVYLLWELGSVVWGTFSGATDTVKSAAIAFFGSVVVLVVGRYFEARGAAKQRINAEKIEIYKKFYKLYFDLMHHEKLHGAPKPEKEILAEMLDFQKEVIFWGSDSVIRAYVKFHQAAVSSTIDSAADDLPAKMASILSNVSDVLLAMRRDVGYPFTSVNVRDLARLQLASDAETMKIFDHL